MMPIPYWQRPQRVTGSQWNDIKHHYQDAEWDDLPPLCECEDPECEVCEPLHEDRGVGQYYEASQSPYIEE